MEPFLFLIGAASFCIVVVALFCDKTALRFAAIIKARCEARHAYRERYAAALARIESEFGLEAMGK